MEKLWDLKVENKMVLHMKNSEKHFILSGQINETN